MLGGDGGAKKKGKNSDWSRWEERWKKLQEGEGRKTGGERKRLKIGRQSKKFRTSQKIEFAQRNGDKGARFSLPCKSRIIRLFGAENWQKKVFPDCIQTILRRQIASVDTLYTKNNNNESIWFFVWTIHLLLVNAKQISFSPPSSSPPSNLWK